MKRAAAAPKPRTRGWLHAGMFPLALNGGIVLFPLALTGGGLRAVRVD